MQRPLRKQTHAFSMSNNAVEALAMQELNIVMGDPNLQTEDFIHSFNQTVRTSFFQNVHFLNRKRLGLARNGTITEFPLTKSMQDFFKFRNDHPAFSGMNEMKWGVEKHKSNMKRELRHSQSKDNANLCPSLRRTFSLSRQKNKERNPCVQTFTTRVSEVMSERQHSNPPNTKNPTAYVSKVRSRLVRSNLVKQNSLITPIESKDFHKGVEKHIKSIPINSIPVPVLAKIKTDTENKENNQSHHNQEAISFLNKKLDSFRQCGQGTSILKNLFRRMNKTSEPPLSKKLETEMDDQVTINRDTFLSKPQGPQAGSIKILLRNRALRNTDYISKHIADNQKASFKFQMPQCQSNSKSLNWPSSNFKNQPLKARRKRIVNLNAPSEDDNDSDHSVDGKKFSMHDFIFNQSQETKRASKHDLFQIRAHTVMEQYIY